MENADLAIAQLHFPGTQRRHEVTKLDRKTVSGRAQHKTHTFACLSISYFPTNKDWRVSPLFANVGGPLLHPALTIDASPQKAVGFCYGAKFLEA